MLSHFTRALWIIRFQFLLPHALYAQVKCNLKDIKVDLQWNGPYLGNLSYSLLTPLLFNVLIGIFEGSRRCGVRMHVCRQPWTFRQSLCEGERESYKPPKTGNENREWEVCKMDLVVKTKWKIPKCPQQAAPPQAAGLLPSLWQKPGSLPGPGDQRNASFGSSRGTHHLPQKFPSQGPRVPQQWEPLPNPCWSSVP